MTADIFSVITFTYYVLFFMMSLSQYWCILLSWICTGACGFFSLNRFDYDEYLLKMNLNTGNNTK